MLKNFFNFILFVFGILFLFFLVKNHPVIFKKDCKEGRLTFAMIKPHILKSKDHVEIFKIIERNNIEIKSKKKIIMTNAKFYELYREHKNKPFFKELQQEMVGKRVIVMILKSENENVVEKWRNLIGDSDPSKAKEGTIRKKFALDKTRNAVHGADSIKAAFREISIFFPEEHIESCLH